MLIRNHMGRQVRTNFGLGQAYALETYEATRRTSMYCYHACGLDLLRPSPALFFSHDSDDENARRPHTCNAQQQTEAG